MDDNHTIIDVFRLIITGIWIIVMVSIPKVTKIIQICSHRCVNFK